MSSPVLAALANARVREQAEKDRALTAKVLAHLKMPEPQGDRSHWPTFQEWCAKSNLTALPTLPAAVAVFVLNNAALGDRLEKIIGSISIVHQDRGVADPTLSPVVIAALNHVLPAIEPPRWNTTHKATFQQLPRDIQRIISTHEASRTKEIKRLQREYAQLRKEHHEQESTPAAGTDRTDAGRDSA